MQLGMPKAVRQDKTEHIGLNFTADVPYSRRSVHGLSTLFTDSGPPAIQFTLDAQVSSIPHHEPSSTKPSQASANKPESGISSFLSSAVASPVHCWLLRRTSSIQGGCSNGSALRMSSKLSGVSRVRALPSSFGRLRRTGLDETCNMSGISSAVSQQEDTCSGETFTVTFPVPKYPEKGNQ